MMEDRIVAVEITYQEEVVVPEDPRSAGPTPFLQETRCQPNRKKERRSSIGPKVRFFVRGDKPIILQSQLAIRYQMKLLRNVISDLMMVMSGGSRWVTKSGFNTLK
jgi:hypothetical protein